jgi:hypothetical protein
VLLQVVRRLGRVPFEAGHATKIYGKPVHVKGAPLEREIANWNPFVRTLTHERDRRRGAPPAGYIRRD